MKVLRNAIRAVAHVARRWIGRRGDGHVVAMARVVALGGGPWVNSITLVPLVCASGWPSAAAIGAAGVGCAGEPQHDD